MCVCVCESVCVCVCMRECNGYEGKTEAFRKYDNVYKCRFFNDYSAITS